MNTLQFTGVIHQIKETQVISDTFSKREFILTDEHETYPKFINFELIKDNCDLIANHKVGQKITVNFNLDGRLWTNPKTNEERCFNTLKVWRIESLEDAAPIKVKGNIEKNFVEDSISADSSPNDLPF